MKFWLTNTVHIQKSNASEARVAAGSTATPELAEKRWDSGGCCRSSSPAKCCGHLPIAACQMYAATNYN